MPADFITVELFFRQINERLFGGQLEEARVEVCDLPSGTWAECARAYFWEKGVSRIRIGRRLLYATHPSLDKSMIEGHRRFLYDVVMHEAVHAYQRQFLTDMDPDHGGHGPGFLEASRQLTYDLEPRRRKSFDVLNIRSCKYWPHICRPSSFYGNAVRTDYKEAARLLA